MSENFSKSFESSFRIIFIIWVSIWGFVDLSRLLLQYASFDNIENQAGGLGYWWLTTFGAIVTIAAGVLLLFMMSAIPGIIAKSKKITNIPLLTALVIFYYLFVTLITTFAGAVYKQDTFARDFVFTSLWIMPSIIMMVIHILYIGNLRKYNHELETVKIV